jgi:hypothetical protein
MQHPSTEPVKYYITDVALGSAKKPASISVWAGVRGCSDPANGSQHNAQYVTPSSYYYACNLVHHSEQFHLLVATRMSQCNTHTAQMQPQRVSPDTIK